MFFWDSGVWGGFFKSKFASDASFFEILAKSRKTIPILIRFHTDFIPISIPISYRFCTDTDTEFIPISYRYRFWYRFDTDFNTDTEVFGPQNTDTDTEFKIPYRFITTPHPNVNHIRYTCDTLIKYFLHICSDFLSIIYEVYCLNIRN